MMWTICLAVALAGFAEDAEDLDRAKIRDAVVLNRQYLDSIHTLEAEIETWSSKDGGKTWALISKENWLKAGPRERLREVIIQLSGRSSEDDSKKIWNDTYYGENETRIMSRWNWGDPPSEKPDASNRYHGAKATLGGKTPKDNIAGGPAYSMGLAANMKRYLPDLVKVSNAELIKGPDARKDMVGIKCVEPTNKWAYSIFLDKSKGYMIGRREIVVPQGKGVPKPSKAIHEVVETTEPQSGLFIPTRVRFTTAGDPLNVVESRVKKLEINKPIDESKVFMQFPEGMKVFDSPNNKYCIWGTNAPRLTFTEKEMQNYDMKHGMRDGQSVSKRSAIRNFIAFNALAALVFAGLLGYRRMLKSKESKDIPT